MIVTKRQATKVLSTVEAFNQTTAVLREPGELANGWAIYAEADFDWTIAFSAAASDLDLPDGVFVEPVNSCVLGVYPA